MIRRIAFLALLLCILSSRAQAADRRLKDFPSCPAVATTTSIYVDRGIGATTSERATPAQVCQAGATTTPAAGVVPKADGAGLLPAGFLPAATTSTAGAAVLATPSSDTTAGHVVQASDPRLPPIPTTDDTLLLANGTAWQAKAVPNCTDSGGNHLNYTASTNAFSCGTSGGGGGSGTVTSVNASVPSWLAVSGGPVTGSGTLAIAAATGQTAGRVIGTCGAGTSVSLCALVAGDLPLVTAAKGGTGLDTSGSTGVLRVSGGTWTANAGISHLASSTSADLRGVLSDETGSGAAVFGTSPTVTDATVNQAANGDAVLTATRATDTSPTGSFSLYKSAAGATLWNVDITGSLAAGTVPVARVSGLAASATTDATSASNISAGTLAVARGGTGTGSTLTGLVRGSGSAMTAAELSGDATTSGSNVVNVGKINGVSLAGLATGILKNTTATGAPSIAVAGDFPTLNQNTSGTAADLSATLIVGHGGTGASSLAAHGVVIGNGASAVNVTGAGTAGQVLTSNGASADPSFQTAAHALTIAKTSDESQTASTTLTNDGTLSLTLTVGRWDVSLLLNVESPPAAGWQMALGGTATFVTDVSSSQAVDDTGWALFRASTFSFTGMLNPAGDLANPNTYSVTVNTVINVSSGGTVRLRWAQEVSDVGFTKVKLGSRMKAEPL